MVGEVPVLILWRQVLGAAERLAVATLEEGVVTAAFSCRESIGVRTVVACMRIFVLIGQEPFIGLYTELGADAFERAEETKSSAGTGGICCCLVDFHFGWVLSWKGQRNCL